MLDRGEFENWLHSLPGHHNFWKYASRDCWCPIARFVQEKQDDPDIRITTTCVQKYGFFDSELPMWACIFIHRFDTSTNEKPQACTVALAIEVLKTC